MASIQCVQRKKYQDTSFIRKVKQVTLSFTLKVKQEL